MNVMLILNIALGVVLGLFGFLVITGGLAVMFLGTAFIYKLGKISN